MAAAIVDSDIGAITRDQNRHIFRAEVDYVHYLDRGAVSARLGGGASHYEETFTDPITGAEKISGWNPRMYAGVAASYRPFTAFPRTSVGFSLNAETALRDNPVGGYNYYLGGLHTLAAYEDSYFAGDSGYNTAIEVKGYLPEEVVAEGMDVELGAFFQHGGVFEGMLFDPHLRKGRILPIASGLRAASCLTIMSPSMPRRPGRLMAFIGAARV